MTVEFILNLVSTLLNWLVYRQKTFVNSNFQMQISNQKLAILRPDCTTAKFFARNCVSEIRIAAHERFYSIFPLFSAFEMSRTGFYSLVKRILAKPNLSLLRMHS